MLRLLLLFVLTGIYFISFSQSDFISVRKKNGRIIKTFTAGSPIIFETKQGIYIKGAIEAIKNDSVFIRTYNIQTVPTNLSVYMLDTVSKNIAGFHYKDILRIKVFKRLRFVRGKIDKLLMYGGAGYFGLNVINSAINHQSLTEKGNLKNLGISVAAFGLGFLIKKFFYVNRFSRKWHKIVYVNIH